jgi:hypothetical protein
MPAVAATNMASQDRLKGWALKNAVHGDEPNASRISDGTRSQMPTDRAFLRANHLRRDMPRVFIAAFFY